jgi:hypothetical protein
MSEKRRRLTYANVMSSIAVFLCLGGTAVAAATIDGSSIDNRSIAGKKLIKNTVTGTEIKEASLGKVPNADKLDGIDSTGFVKGSNARLLTKSARIVATDNIDSYDAVYTLPGLGSLNVQCSDSANRFAFQYLNTSGTKQQYAFTTSSLDSSPDVVTYGDYVDADGQILDSVTNSSPSRGFHIELTVISSSATHYAQITLTGVTDTNGAGGLCDYAATAIVH